MFSRVLILTLILATTWSTPSRGRGAAHPAATGPDLSSYQITIYEPETLFTVGAHGLGKAAADTFYLYGGPDDPTEYGDPLCLDGKWEDTMGAPCLDGWTGVDRTMASPFWQTSTFNSPTGTMALWSGQSAEQQPGWVAGAGYGNGWNDWIDFHAPVTDNTIPTTVNWSFVYNYDSEWGYDYCHADYDTGDGMESLLSVWGSNKDTAGVFQPLTANLSVTLQPDAYVGDDSNEVHLRFRVTSDGAWSDEDGLWPTDGAMQIDDVLVDLGSNGGSWFDDFESGFGNWVPTPADFVGDFAKVFPFLDDLDPCTTNRTPQLAFIDDGTPPRNGGGQSTGGSTSSTYGYALPGGFVVNYTGGLAGGRNRLNNAVLSPVIDYDLPGPADDAADGVLMMAFDLWEHLPLINGMFWMWEVRSTEDPAGTTGWTQWESNSFVYYGDGLASRKRIDRNVAHHLPDPTAVEKVQFALSALDLADIFAFPGSDATPSPSFDNFSVRKAAPAGPRITVRAADLLQDAFPGEENPALYDGPTGPFDEALFSIRLDRATPINQGGMNLVAGDSVSLNVVPAVPGTDLAGTPVLHYLLYANPAFDHVRDISGYGTLHGAILGPGGSHNWNVWQGSVPMSETFVNGTLVEDIYHADPPFDGQFDRLPGGVNDPDEPNGFFPGDWFFYYVAATDDAGNTVVIPAGPAGGVPRNWPLVGPDDSAGEIDRYADLARSIYDRNWRIRGLPSIDANGDTPDILFVNDAFGFGNSEEWSLAWKQNGLLEGVDYDDFTVMSPNNALSNGIGSAGLHGATGLQLEGYSCLFYDGGHLQGVLLSNGEIYPHDAGNDQEAITDWYAADGDRRAAFFGDELPTFLMNNSTVFMTDILGIQVGAGGDDVRPQIGGQTAPLIAPTAAAAGMFSTGLVAYGGCPTLNHFDHMEPAVGKPAVRFHEFLNPIGQGGTYSAAASVWHEWQVESSTKVAMTLAVGFQSLGDLTDATPASPSARSAFVAEILAAFGHPTNPGQVTDTPAASESRFALHQNNPNPFNPSTRIAFSTPTRGDVSLRVYDLRGRLVRTLLSEVRDAGDQHVIFDGLDDTGAALSSGVYVVRLQAEGRSEVRKIALAK